MFNLTSRRNRLRPQRLSAIRVITATTETDANVVNVDTNVGNVDTNKQTKLTLYEKRHTRAHSSKFSQISFPHFFRFFCFRSEKKSFLSKSELFLQFLSKCAQENQQRKAEENIFKRSTFLVIINKMAKEKLNLEGKSIFYKVC